MMGKTTVTSCRFFDLGREFCVLSAYAFDFLGHDVDIIGEKDIRVVPGISLRDDGVVLRCDATSLGSLPLPR